jgi:hypothetical protein
VSPTTFRESLRIHLSKTRRLLRRSFNFFNQRSPRRARTSRVKPARFPFAPAQTINVSSGSTIFFAPKCSTRRRQFDPRK